ncbi:MAG: hypothetical protein ACRDRZ_05200 [Pseudonocardiaceae bacterium]
MTEQDSTNGRMPDHDGSKEPTERRRRWTKAAASAGAIGVGLLAGTSQLLQQALTGGLDFVAYALAALVTLAGVVFLVASLRKVELDKLIAWTAAAGLLLVIVSPTAVYFLTRPPKSPPVPSITPSLDVAGCQIAIVPNATRPAVQTLISGLIADEFSYSLSNILPEQGKPIIEASGRLVGSQIGSQRIMMFRWASQEKVDLQGVPGNGRYYRLDNFRINKEGCWKHDRGSFAYPGANGLVFRHIFIVVPDESFSEVSSREQSVGFSDEDLTRLNLQQIAYFDVPIRLI